jgi:hypothetical protein
VDSVQYRADPHEAEAMAGRREAESGMGMQGVHSNPLGRFLRALVPHTLLDLLVLAETFEPTG